MDRAPRLPAPRDGWRGARQVAFLRIPTWTRTVALVREHAALREAIGGECPSADAHRFATKLRAYSDVSFLNDTDPDVDASGRWSS